MSEATEQKTRKVKRYEGKMEDERYRVPTGRLRIFVERGYGKVWSCEERVEAPLETKLNGFFAGVWKQVVLCRQKTREQEARSRREAEAAALRAEADDWSVRLLRGEEEEKRRVSAGAGGGGVASGERDPGVCGGGEWKPRRCVVTRPWRIGWSGRSGWRVRWIRSCRAWRQLHERRAGPSAGLFRWGRGARSEQWLDCADCGRRPAEFSRAAPCPGAVGSTGH